MYRSASDWEKFVGERVKSSRLRQNISQEEVASRAGLSTVTVSRLETGKGSSLETLIKVLQVLKEDPWLELLAQDAGFSPIEQFHMKKQRERSRRATKPEKREQ